MLTDTEGEGIIQVSSSEIVPFADPAESDDYRIIHSIAGRPGVAIVDNENYQYHLQAAMTDIGDDPSAMALAACSIRLSKYFF